MTLRQMERRDRVQAETMWRDTFEESPAFTAYYFDRRFHPEYSFGAFDEERLIAMALGRPTEINVAGRAVPALLVAGVSTVPEFRNKGLMHRLMTMLTDRARAAGFACCYLHPVSETLYASLGFRNGTDALIVRSDETRTHAPFVLSDRFDANDILSVYCEAQRTHDGMQMRDEEELLTVFADYATDGGTVLIAYDRDRPVGYICFSLDGLVHELTALCRSAYETLLDEAARRAGREIKAIVPIDCWIPGERVFSMQYLVFDDAFDLPLNNGFCRLAY